MRVAVDLPLKESMKTTKPRNKLKQIRDRFRHLNPKLKSPLLYDLPWLAGAS